MPKAGGVVGLCTEGQAARPGIVLGATIVQGEPEPRLDVIALVALAPGRGPAPAVPCIMLAVPFENSKAKGTGLWWKYSGPEVLVRGPIGGERES